MQGTALRPAPSRYTYPRKYDSPALELEGFSCKSGGLRLLADRIKCQRARSDPNGARTFVTSADLGSMGFGYPAAVGAKVARPDKEVIDIDGDGSFLMNVQELATAHIEGIAAKAIILNNQHLGMVVQWEDRFHGGNRGHTFLGDPKDLKRIYPDYVQICKGFGVTCERVIHKKDLRAAIGRLLASKEVYVLDVMTPYTEHVLPMIPSGRTYKDIITE